MPASVQPIKGKFRVTFEHGKDANGKRTRSTKTVKTQEEAIKLKAEFEYNEQLSLSTKHDTCTSNTRKGEYDHASEYSID